MKDFKNKLDHDDEKEEVDAKKLKKKILSPICLLLFHHNVICSFGWNYKS